MVYLICVLGRNPVYCFENAQKFGLVWFGLNLFHCSIITIGSVTSYKTYVALSLYINWPSICLHANKKSHMCK